MTIIVPFAAGGSADVYGRILAQQLNAATGHPFIVEDRPGAGSIIGSEAVATSAPDGYTLLMISNTHTVNETLFPHKPYKLMTNFVPIAPINYADLVLVTHPALGVKTPQELIKLAKAEARQADLRVLGAGHAVPHGRRAVQTDGRHRHRACAVQGQLRSPHRRHRRPGRYDVRRDHRRWSA